MTLRWSSVDLRLARWLSVLRTRYHLHNETQRPWPCYSLVFLSAHWTKPMPWKQHAKLIFLRVPPVSCPSRSWIDSTKREDEKIRVIFDRISISTCEQCGWNQCEFTCIITTCIYIYVQIYLIYLFDYVLTISSKI